MSTTVLDKPERESKPGSNFTIRKDPTNPWITKLLGKSFLKETNQDLLQPETERKSFIKRDTVSHIDVLKNRQKTVLTKPPCDTKSLKSLIQLARVSGSRCSLTGRLLHHARQAIGGVKRARQWNP
jgi:hypothetical protein